MKLRYYSDIHNELLEGKDEYFSPAIMPDEKDQVLVLAGDILKLHHIPRHLGFFQSLGERFKAFFYVFGNHEYYGGKIGEKYTQRAVKALSVVDNLHVLSRFTPSVYLDGFKFVGATLWTNPRQGYLEKQKSNDLKKIKYHDSVKNSYHAFNPVAWRREFDADFAWIRSETRDDYPTIVITHHAPSLFSVDEYDYDGSSAIYYKTDLSDFIDSRPNIKVWVHGHIHNRNHYELKGTLITSNPVGYPNAQDNRYKPHKIDYALPTSHLNL